VQESDAPRAQRQNVSVLHGSSCKWASIEQPTSLISKEFGVRFLKEFWEDFKLIIEGLKEEKLSHGFSFFRFV
jgi:hypothetical protein